MSLKADAFRVIHAAPKTVCKFMVMLPGISTQSLFQVSAASIPYPKVLDTPIYFAGHPTWVPVRRESDGLWTCTLMEDNTMTGAMLISQLERYTSGLLYGDAKVSDLYDTNYSVFIMLMDETTGLIPIQVVELKYAFLKEVKPSNLDWSKPDQPMSYDLTFRYSAIRRLV